MPKPTQSSPEPARQPALAGRVSSHRLANGMKLIVVERPDLPTAATFLVYGVGSVDEPAGATGMSHFLEHLLFKGTERMHKGDIDAGTQRRGGYNNAYTTYDITAYHFAFAADRWEWALAVEADRMRNCVFEPQEFEAERQVVLEELASNLDMPWDLLDQEMSVLAWSANGYGHPTQGWRPDMQTVSRERVVAHYKTFYRPDNATLVVAGGVEAARVLARVRELFEAIPAGGAAAAEVQEQPQDWPPRGARRSELHGPWGVSRMLLGFRTVPSLHADRLPLDVAARVLASGQKSRLERALVQEAGLATEVFAAHDNRLHGGLFLVGITAVPGADRAQIEAVVQHELAAMAREGATEAELARARRAMLVDLLNAQEQVLSTAETVGWETFFHGPDSLGSLERDLAAVDSKAIQRVLAAYADPEHAITAWALPEEEPSEEADPPGDPAGHTPGPMRWYRGAKAKAPAQVQAAGDSGSDAALDRVPRIPHLQVERTVLPGGLRLCIAPIDGLPLTAATAWIDAGAIFDPKGKEGLAEVCGRLVADRMRAAIEDLGGRVHGEASLVAVKVAGADLGPALKALAAALRDRHVEPEAFERIRREVASAASARQDDPEVIAADELEASVYGPHPLARLEVGTPESVAAIRPEDVADFYAEFYRPERTIVSVAGACDAAAVRGGLQTALARWECRGEAPSRPEQPKPLPSTVRRIQRPGEQAHMMLGHLGVTRNDPDYVALRVLEQILGGGSGFTDRLSRRLRDQEGLAYTVYADCTGGAGTYPGMFRAYIGCSPENVDRARTEILEEIAKVRETGVTADELRDAKRFLMGSLVFRAETRDQISGFLIEAERFELGWDYLERMPERLAAVSAEELLRVARAHLDPKALHVIIVGP